MKKKKKKKSQSGTFLGQLNNIAIYNMDGNDKIIIIFTGIIKLEIRKIKQGRQIWGTTMGKTRGHHVYKDIYRQSTPLCLQLFYYSNVWL